MRKALSGVVTAMITPFDADGNVDYGYVKQLLEFLIPKKINAVFVAGTTGEMFKMNLEERKRLTKEVVKIVNKRIDVCIHVGSMNGHETIELAKHAEAAGADFIAAVTPSYFSANPVEIEKYFVSVASAISPDFPMYLYNIPQLSGNMLTADIVRKVVLQCPNVVGVKYSNSDMLLTYDYLTVKDGFSVLQGTDRCFLPAMLMGCDGTVSGISCVYPEPFVKVHETYKSGDLEKCREFQKIATMYCNVLRHGANMAYFKTGLAYRGLPKSHMRTPHLDLAPDVETAFLAELKSLNDQYFDRVK